jgi:hypothetical protein
MDTDKESQNGCSINVWTHAPIKLFSEGFFIRVYQCSSVVKLLVSSIEYLLENFHICLQKLRENFPA